ncbi:MAG: hypothetical protein KBT03_01270 [Bacteroidales bacterium]|nr:hypothetical protein [Candidatus Scybalousia scybalohippi]
MDNYERKFQCNVLRFMIKSTLEIMLDEFQKIDVADNFSGEEIRIMIIESTNELLNIE